MPSIYLDHASSTACDPAVIEAMRPFFFEKHGNASSPHVFGRQARKATEDARQSLAALIGSEEREVVFNSGATEGNNQAIWAAAHALKNHGRHIIASAIEHHSVLEPLHRLRQENFEVTLVRPASDGIIRPQDFRAALRPDTILACLIHANNEIGTLQPVAEIGKIIKERQTTTAFLVDATQTIGHMPVNVKDLNCDFLSFSAHKFYGPQGVGGLFIRKGKDWPAFLLGGDQERGRRAGTLNTSGIVGMAQAAKIAQSNMSQEAQRETALRDRIIDTVLKDISSAMLNGHRHQRLSNNAHFSISGLKGEDIVSALDMVGIAVSMGSACTWGRLEPSHVLKAIGRSDDLAYGSLRVSVGRWTKDAQIDYFLEQLKIKVKALKV